MYSKLEEVFQALGLDYSRQGSYSDDSEYPESFFTFWNMDTPTDGYYDNKNNRSIWYWQVYYYTNDATTVYSKMREFEDIARSKGFVLDSRSYDAPSDRADYFGRMITVKYIEYNA